MVCKKCGNEVFDENAVYCNACGSRLDGKKMCSACKKPNEESATYCAYCGERLDGKTVCASCQTAYHGQFCPTCGKSSACATGQTGARVYNRERIFKAFDVVGSGLMMLGVLFSLIFVFLISVSVDISLINMQEFEGDTSVSIFDYFGKYYNEMGEYPIEIKWFYETMSAQELIMGIFGTVIVSLTLCAVVGFAVVAIVIYVRNWMGISERRADKWALASIISFFSGVVLFYGLHKFMMDYSGFTIGFKLSPATIWGVVLCSVALVCGVVCKLIGKAKELVKPKKYVIVALSLLGIAFCATLFALFGNFSILSEMTVAKETFDVAGGAFMGNILMIICAELKMEHLSRGNETDLIYANVDAFVILNTVIQILLILAVIAIFICVIQKLGNLFSEKQRVVLPWAIAVAVLAVGCLVLSIIAKNYLTEIYELDISISSTIAASVPDLKAGLLMPILLVVFSVLNFAMACVQTGLNAKWGKIKQAE